MLQLKGKLKIKGSEQAVSERFRKREFIVTDDSSQYPQYISFQLTQDKCQLLDNVNVGDEIIVSFNLRGREWKSPQGEIKYFNSLEAWKIDVNSASGPFYDEMPIHEENKMSGGATDDLPF